MYLNNMLPLPVNSNPGIVFPRQNFKRSTRLMHKYLARIMYGISEFKQTLERYAILQCPEQGLVIRLYLVMLIS